MRIFRMAISNQTGIRMCRDAADSKLNARAIGLPGQCPLAQPGPLYFPPAVAIIS